MGTFGTVVQVERRRQRGLELRKKGKTQAAVAKALGVTERTVRKWEYEKRNPSLKVKAKRGRPAKLSSSQLAKLEKLMLRGSVAHGYPDESWTLDRVCQLVWQSFGVRYDPSGMWHVLERLGWSCQRPQRRSVMRVDADVETWLRRTWPKIKKKAFVKSLAGFRG